MDSNGVLFPNNTIKSSSLHDEGQACSIIITFNLGFLSHKYFFLKRINLSGKISMTSEILSPTFHPNFSFEKYFDQGCKSFSGFEAKLAEKVTAAPRKEL